MNFPKQKSNNFLSPKSKQNSDDFIEEFKPALRFGQKLAIVSFFLVIVMITSKPNLWSILLASVILIGTVLVFIFKIRCPRCGGYLSWGWLYRIPSYRRCINCGAILVKGFYELPSRPWIPWNKKTRSDKTFTLISEGFRAGIAIIVIITALYIILKSALGF